MDEIETGFTRILEKIQQAKEQKQALSGTVRKNEAGLLARMAQSAIPIVKEIGTQMLQKGKQETSGELYDTRFYEEKMLIIGKSEPAPFRPDNPAKKVIDQFCVLSENGVFYEIMYSSDGFVTDSYLNRLDAAAVLDLYSYDALFMLYSAMHDYLKNEEALVQALETTISFVFAQEKGQ
jgi:hypothetical protein